MRIKHTVGQSAEHDNPTSPQPATQIDWRDVAKAAVSSAFVAGVLGGALHLLGRMLEEDPPVEEREVSVGSAERGSAFEDAAPEPVSGDDPEEIAAAGLLGVRLDASEDEIRAALRSRLSSSVIHPDHGGDGEAAKQLIAAKNLLVERARARVAS